MKDIESGKDCFLYSEVKDDDMFWHVLVVDNDTDIHFVTEAAIQDIIFKNKKIKILHASTENEAKIFLAEVPDIAVIFVNLVMSSETCNFFLIDHVRKKLKNNDVRIILRTKYPDEYLEDRIIINYDINDYKSKKEISTGKLMTMIVSALRSYSDRASIHSKDKAIIDKDNKLLIMKNNLENILNAMPAMVIVTNSDGFIKNWNKSAETISNITKKEAVGKSVFEILPLSPFIEHFVSVLDTGKMYVCEKAEININKSKFFRVTMFKMVNEDKNSVIFNLIDITEISIIEEKLNFSQKMELIGTLTSGLVHDFNNALGSINCSLSTLRMQLDDMTKKDEYIASSFEIVDDSINQMSGIIKQFKSLSESSSESFDPTDLIKAVQLVTKVGIRKVAQNIIIQTDILVNNAEIYGDIVQVEEAVLNICINAEHAINDYTKDNKTKSNYIKLILDKVNIISDADINCCFIKNDVCASSGDYFVISIEDSGHGIKKDDLQNIFNPFFTTRKDLGGTGLGLAMVSNIMKKHFGFIAVDSKINKGTKFSLFFPTVDTYRKISNS